MTVTLKQIEAFLTVADTGSFTRAAERLALSQPVCSSLVRDLEQTLGVRLLDRTTRRVEVTPVGREFEGAMLRLRTDLDRAVMAAKAVAARESGRLAVAAPPLLAASLLPPVIAAFGRDYPGVRLTLQDARTDSIADLVQSGQVDVGIGTFRADERGLSRTRLVRDTLAVFVSRSDPLAQSETVAWHDLAGRPLITLLRGAGVRALVDLGYESAGLTAEPLFEVNQMGTAVALVEAGLGLAILPAYARTLLPARDIRVRPLIDPVVSREISVVRAADRSTPPSFQAFLRLLRRQAGTLFGEAGRVGAESQTRESGE